MVDEGKSHPVQYDSRTMNPTEKYCPICEKEGLAVDFVQEKFSHYQISAETVTIITSNPSLSSAFKW